MTTPLNTTEPLPHVLAVIPARYASTRFPGKPLVKIQGKPMIQHVWDRVKQTTTISRAVVATDDIRIADAVKAFGGDVMMTDPNHPSGSDRIWEVAQELPEYDWVMNVQGDEPFLNPVDLDQVIATAQRYQEADVITLVSPINGPDAQQAWQDPNIVKAVMNSQGRIFYFSRASIPYQRDNRTQVPDNALRHLGLYLYRRKALARFTQLPPSRLEQAEKLEQLRGLEDGMIFYGVVVQNTPIGIDTPEDLQRLIPTL